MLRSAWQAGLNELLVRCRDAALRYRDAAALAPEPGLKRKLEDLATVRDQAVAELENHIRETGDLPDAADADRESLRRLGSLARAAVSEGKEGVRSVLCREAVEIEQGIARQAERLLDMEGAGAARTTVQRIADSAVRAARWLAPES